MKFKNSPMTVTREYHMIKLVVGDFKGNEFNKCLVMPQRGCIIV